MPIEHGYFFITDITGYIQFLTHSELDHAKEVLDALFDSILNSIEPPLIVSNTQGDAIISYAPERAFLQSQILLDSMEKSYFGFRRQLELMDLNTNCDCNACMNMSALDLKIFLHYGEYLVQQIGEHTDLQGSDVILAHRLMKNTVTETFGLSGYGLSTQAAIEAMNIAGVKDDLMEHVEHYEHLGEVKVYIHDLRKAWENERDRRRIFVSADDAIVCFETFVPVSAWTAWDYATDMTIKTRYWDLDRIERDGEHGRDKIGTAFHCHHRFGTTDYIYVDWDPPNYFTAEYTDSGAQFLVTVRVTPVNGGSKFEMLYGEPYKEYPEEIVDIFRKGGKIVVETFAEIIAEELRTGRIKSDQIEATSSRSALGRLDVTVGRFGNI